MANGLSSLGTSYILDRTFFPQLFVIQHFINLLIWVQQSSAFKILKTRLKTVTSFSFSFSFSSNHYNSKVVHHPQFGTKILEDGYTKLETADKHELDFTSMLQQFDCMQTLSTGRLQKDQRQLRKIPASLPKVSGLLHFQLPRLGNCNWNTWKNTCRHFIKFGDKLGLRGATSLAKLLTNILYRKDKSQKVIANHQRRTKLQLHRDLQKRFGENCTYEKEKHLHDICLACVAVAVFQSLTGTFFLL